MNTIYERYIFRKFSGKKIVGNFSQIFWKKYPKIFQPSHHWQGVDQSLSILVIRYHVTGFKF